ncbi:MAG: glutamyl-tRNA reductase [Archaeoglobaceae archaeon]
MQISCLTLSHRQACVEEIEKVWKSIDIVSLLRNSGLKESAFIFTCNRIEIYGVGENSGETLAEMAKEIGMEKAELLVGDDCLRHILRVASGLESMIVGEDQILGQVRYYHNLCKKEGLCGEVLDRVFRKAVSVGVKVRRETRISRGAVSIGSAAVELAERELGSLSGKNVLLIGAGEMGTLVAKALAGKNVNAILIANRTYEKAVELAKRIGGTAVRFDKLEECLRIADIVISATSAPHVILTREIVEKAVGGRKLLIIDIALPRDVDDSVGELENVTLLTIDNLRSISEENLRRRLSEVEKAERIIETELEHLKLMLRDLRAKRAIASMYCLAERYIDEEVEELFAKLASRYNVGEDCKDILYDFAKSLIRKFLRNPTVKLREAVRNGNPHYADVVEKLFGGEYVSARKDEKAEEGHLKTARAGNEVER